ncbi:MAG TPA: mismatch repair protein, partial [Terriglobales bacterium]
MSPADDYRERLKDRQERVGRYEKIHVRLGNTRLVLAAAAAILAWESLWRHAFSGWWIALPIVAFVLLVAYHSSVLRAQELAARAVNFYERGLARIEERWAGTGQTGDRFLDPHHEYAADLDLFGRGGLFELLSTARTRMGEETLAEWLLS